MEGMGRTRTRGVPPMSSVMSLAILAMVTLLTDVRLRPYRQFLSRVVGIRRRVSGPVDARCTGVCVECATVST